MTASGVFPFLGDIPLIPWCDVDGFPFQSVFIRVKCGDYCCPVRHSAAGCGGRADRQTVRALQGRCTVILLAVGEELTDKQSVLYKVGVPAQAVAGVILYTL